MGPSKEGSESRAGQSPDLSVPQSPHPHTRGLDKTTLSPFSLKSLCWLRGSHTSPREAGVWQNSSHRPRFPCSFMFPLS